MQKIAGRLVVREGVPKLLGDPRRCAAIPDGPGSVGPRSTLADEHFGQDPDELGAMSNPTLRSADRGDRFRHAQHQSRRAIEVSVGQPILLLRMRAETDMLRASISPSDEALAG
jgi:hypothetical protein